MVYISSMQWRRRHFFPFKVTCNVKRSVFCIHVIGLLGLASVLVIFVFCHWVWLLGKTAQREIFEYIVPGVQFQKTEVNQTSVKNTLKEASHYPHILSVNLSSIQMDASLQEVTKLKSSLTTNTSLFSEMGIGRQTTQPYPYLINEPDKCKNSNIFLIILVTVEPNQVDARDAIRQTWGNDSVAPGLGVVHLFMLGYRNDSDGYLQRFIEKESQQHHDIIQHAYQDTYQNLTIKTLMGLNWVASHCSHAKYIMKTDSDMFVNTEYLIYKLLKPDEPQRQNYFTGYLMRGYAPNRNKDSRWYMSPHQYSSERYPVFCSGTGYVMSGDMAEKIYKVSLSIPLLHLEDVYVGICLAKLHIEPIPPPNEFLFHHWRVLYSSCKYSHLVTSHQFKPNEIIKYWNHLQKNKHNPCSNTMKVRNGRF